MESPELRVAARALSVYSAASNAQPAGLIAIAKQISDRPSAVALGDAGELAQVLQGMGPWASKSEEVRAALAVLEKRQASLRTARAFPGSIQRHATVGPG